MLVNDGEQVWTAVAEIIRSQVSESAWMSTFQLVTAAEHDGDADVLYLVAPNSISRDRLLTRYLSLITDALTEVGRPDCAVEVEVADLAEQAELDFGAESAPVMSPSATDTSWSPHDTPGYGTPPRGASPNALNPHYTFDRFVRGQSNQFALAAAERVAETPGRSYNPLFIYGAAGLGKTHLLQAIGHYVQTHYQHDVVLYVSTETFMNEFIEAIRHQRQAEFKRRYRDIDVLIIDDIQFLEGKEGLQEEFFFTFNTLHGANKQIVISSDRPPDAIATLEDRLRGRFQWGLITDIQPPDMETRLAILRNKAERDQSSVSSEILEFIATRVTSNIRALEGALNRVTAYASLNGVHLTTSMAEKLLGDLLTDTRPKVRTDEELLAEIAEILGFSVEALRGRSRQRPLVTARQIAMYAVRDVTELSYPAIARLFGGRDHTTVIHAVDKVQRLVRERQQVYAQVTDLIDRLRKG